MNTTLRRLTRGHSWCSFTSNQARALILGLPLLWLSPPLRAGDGEPVSRTLELHRLMPPDASLVLTVEDLRGRFRELSASPLASDFLSLPAVKKWFESEKYEQLETARDQIEGFLQTKLTEVRDQVLGDAVVIALRLPQGPSVDPSRAEGILALKAADPALLKRLIDLVNTTQKQNGEIASVIEHKRGTTTYFVREFPETANHRPEAYVTFPDGTFGLSNSDGLIADLIDRKRMDVDHGQPAAASLAGVKRFLTLDHRLPRRALARLYVDPSPLATLIKNSPGPKSPVEALIRRYIEGLESAGAALVFAENHLALETAEVFEPNKFQALFGSSNHESSFPPPRIDHVPATALALGAFELDFTALYKLLLQSVPPQEQQRVANIEAVLKGLLLGQDLRSQILPALGPRIVAALDTPAGWKAGNETGSAAGGNWPFPVLMAVDLRSGSHSSPSSPTAGQAKVADALDNALHTVLAVVALNGKPAELHSRVAIHDRGSATVKTLDPPFPFVYALDRSNHRFVLSNSIIAVDHFLSPDPKASAGDRFHRLQARAFPKAGSFLCLDLAAVESMIATHRERIIEIFVNQKPRPRDEVARDLDQFSALSHLFDAIYLTHRTEGESATVRHSLGLLAREKVAPVPAPAKP